MSDFEEKFSFNEDEWNACLRVLQVLKDDPLNNPDNDVLKSLLQKITKQARKTNRKNSYSQKKESDLIVQKSSVIVSNAIEGHSPYSVEPSLSLEEQFFRPLKVAKNCYCCNDSFTLAHFFYNRVCPRCATLNYEKRHSNKDLAGMSAVVTGCRVKVGYATVLKLLRNGANVIGTTRFPASALDQYKGEQDYDQWKDRLTLYGLDLRDLNQIEYFVEFTEKTFPRLDILVNNAAQTIKYPDEYYTPLLSKEQALLRIDHDGCIPNVTPVGDGSKSISSELLVNQNFPTTRFGQPVDERTQTSWNSTLSDIDLIELLEVNLINQISPFLLIKKFKESMSRVGNEWSFIVNVTSTEGLFSHSNKTHHHPHTNMTKASLNMITRTSSSDFAKSNILMNSVDVGWISTGATEALRKKQFEQAYVPPLDSVDGASRIVDLIYRALGGERNYGQLFKDYRVHEW